MKNLKAIKHLENYKGKLQELSGSKPIDLTEIDEAIDEAKAVFELICSFSDRNNVLLEEIKILKGKLNENN